MDLSERISLAIETVVTFLLTTIDRPSFQQVHDLLVRELKPHRGLPDAIVQEVLWRVDEFLCVPRPQSGRGLTVRYGEARPAQIRCPKAIYQEEAQNRSRSTA